MSSGSRERARGLLIKALYQWQLAGHSQDELLSQYQALAEYGRVDQAYFEDLLGRVLAEVPALDPVIARYADRGLDQLDAVARAILLLAMTELKTRDDVPVKVVIDEAIKLAKRYGSTDSYRFINAVLDKSSKTLRASAEVAAG
jgi:transcription antitermination protein NusB